MVIGRVIERIIYVQSGFGLDGWMNTNYNYKMIWRLTASCLTLWPVQQTQVPRYQY